MSSPNREQYKKLSNKIEAKDQTVDEVLKDKKYSVDYFQREYSWQTTHVEQLIDDLTAAFLSEYKASDTREKVADYNNYYLGPFVVSEKDGNRSIIDGQQRLTTLTLFLIFLNNLSKSCGIDSNIKGLIFSEKWGVPSFNIQVEERLGCLEALFEQGQYIRKENDDESVQNMAGRYIDISNSFPEEITPTVLPFFLDWIRHRVILVEIIAYSDDNAYTIFETMNDRGLNLTPAEMLKGFVLSRLADSEDRKKANIYWKEAIQKLHSFDKDEDQKFFQSWLRSQYANTIRASKAGSKNEDFEKIGTRFHNWVKDNLNKMNLNENSSIDFNKFIFEDFTFYLSAYQKLLNAKKSQTEGLENIYYSSKWGIADSLSSPLILAPLNLTDDLDVVVKKMNLVAKYLEIFTVRRSINFKKFSSSSIRYTIHSLVKEIRGKNLEELKSIFIRKIDEMDENWDGLQSFKLHGQNRRFVKYLLSRVTGFLDLESGKPSSFSLFHDAVGGKPYEIEHIWADNYERHRKEFEQSAEFDEWRNRIGALILVPRGTNQSYGGMPYYEKLPHYLRENTLAASLNENFYKNNPNFRNMTDRYSFSFKAHKEFNKDDIVIRQKLLQDICEKIFSFDERF